MENETKMLSAWNEAQSLATDVVNAHDPDMDYSMSDLNSEWRYLSLPSEETLHTIVKASERAVETLPENEQTYTQKRDVARWLLEQNIEIDPSQLEDTEAYFFEDWNRAQEIASRLFNAVLEDDAGYDAVREAWPTETPPAESRIIPAIEDAAEHDSNLDRMNQLTGWLQEYHAGNHDEQTTDKNNAQDDSSDTGTSDAETSAVSEDEPAEIVGTPEKPETVRVPDSDWEETVEIADVLLQCFKDREITFAEVRDEVGVSNLPPRTELSLRIPNITGDNRHELLRDTGEYLLTWHEMEEPEELNAYR